MILHFVCVFVYPLPIPPVMVTLVWPIFCTETFPGPKSKEKNFFPLLLPLWPNSIFSLEYHSLLVPLCKKNNNIQKQKKKIIYILKFRGWQTQHICSCQSPYFYHWRVLEQKPVIFVICFASHSGHTFQKIFSYWYVLIQMKNC